VPAHGHPPVFRSLEQRPVLTQTLSSGAGHLRGNNGGVARIPERVLDLTHRLTPEFPLYPVYDPVTVRDKFSVADDGFYVRSWTFDEHSGTHVESAGRPLLAHCRLCVQCALMGA
jgi:hypothetical protein